MEKECLVPFQRRRKNHEWKVGWSVADRPFTSGIVESKQTGQIEREKEKRTMERRAADRSNDICTRKTFKEIRYWVTLQGMRIFPGISSRSYLFSFEIRHKLRRHNRVLSSGSVTRYPKLVNEKWKKKKIHSTRTNTGRNSSKKFVSSE